MTRFHSFFLSKSYKRFQNISFLKMFFKFSGIGQFRKLFPVRIGIIQCILIYQSFLSDFRIKIGISHRICRNEKIWHNSSATVYLSLIHISEPTRLGMISYAVFCLKKKKKK